MNRQKSICDSKPDVLPPGRVANQCHCGKWFTLPACHAPRHKSCSAACSAKQRAAQIAKRDRECGECGKHYVPRLWQLKLGRGRFCSNACGSKSFAKTDGFAAARAKSGETYKRSLRAGRFQRLSGPAHPLWTGGRRAASRRQMDNGKMAIRNRLYRADNPHKVREWTQRRKLKKTGRLPRGTVQTLFKAQRGRCANCCCKLPHNYHVDHVKPLHLGGEHVKGNIQLLCPTCNVRKWATDPIKFAQKQGRLL